MAKDKETPSQDMTLEESKAFRASAYVPSQDAQTDQQKREAFRLFWAQEKYSYGKSKDLEEILWLHLSTIKKDSPEMFEEGLKHFGLSKIK